MPKIQLPGGLGHLHVVQAPGGQQDNYVEAISLINPTTGEPIDIATTPAVVAVQEAVEGLAATLQAVEQNTGDKVVTVGNFPVTQPVSAAALPLPAGAATEATLAALRSAADAIRVAAEALNAKAVTVDTGNIAGYVVVDNMPAGQATETTLEGVKAAVDALNAKTTGTVELGAASLAALESINVGNLPATQPVSAAALPLPAGAATEATLAALKTAADAIKAAAEALNTKAIEINTGDVSGTVELGAASLAALESVSVSNMPATQPVSAAALPLPAGAATEATLAAIKTAADAIKVAAEALNTKAVALNTGAVAGTVELGAASLAALESVNVANLPVTQPISAAALPLPAGAATDAKQDAMLLAIQALLAELELKPNVGEGGASGSTELDLTENAALRALTKLTYTIQGLRIDCGGSLVALASNQTLGTVSTVGAANNVAIGRTTAEGSSAMLSRLNYTNGFRARLT